MQICEFNKDKHLDKVQECFITLQNAERELDSRMPRGEDIVTEHVNLMLDRCNQCRGKIFIAESCGEVAGYTTVIPKVSSDELDDGGTEYGLISDLVILPAFRERGFGRRLLDVAETYARAHGAKCLRIGVMAMNQAARSLYESSGFEDLYVELEKDLTT